MKTSEQGVVYDINTAPEETILSAKDLMASLGIGKTALWRWVQQKRLPPPFEYCGRAGLWTIGQIRAWRAARALALTAKAQQQMVDECETQAKLQRPIITEFDNAP